MAKHGDTKQRILDVAIRLFAEKGYEDTSLVDISSQAEANKAAINYHFQSKENLYTVAWRTAFENSLAAHPMSGGIPADASAEERLYGHILSLGRRALSTEGYEFTIMEKERANPTGLLKEILHKSILPVLKQLQSIVAELLGPQAKTEHLRLCQGSIMSQCWHIFRNQRPDGCHPHPPLKLNIEEIAQHITQFSLAGIRDMRSRIEHGDVSKQNR